MVKEYLQHSKEILTSEYSGFKFGSKGSGLISLFGYQNEYDLRKGFPLLTTKKMFTRGVIEELIWFFGGNTNIKYLEDQKVSIWTPNVFQFNLQEMIKEGIFPESVGTDEAKYTEGWEQAMNDFGQMIRENEDFSERWGDAGPIYGKQWRNWEHFDRETMEIVSIDQLGGVIEKMRLKPFGKKYIISAWSPGEMKEMSLPPCHVLYHLNVNVDETTDNLTLDLQMYQRSCDMFLGVPFNIASYAMLGQIIAQQLDIEPRRFVHSFGDSHFYTGLKKRSQWYSQNWRELKNRVRDVSDKADYQGVLDWINENAPNDEREKSYDHVTAILEQLQREPKEIPKLKILPGKTLDELTVEDFVLEGYKGNHHPLIKRKMHV